MRRRLAKPRSLLLIEYGGLKIGDARSDVFPQLSRRKKNNLPSDSKKDTHILRAGYLMLTGNQQDGSAVPNPQFSSHRCPF